MEKMYVSPQIEVIEVEVEKGFAVSPDSEGMNTVTGN